MLGITRLKCGNNDGISLLHGPQCHKRNGGAGWGNAAGPPLGEGFGTRDGEMGQEQTIP